MHQKISNVSLEELHSLQITLTLMQRSLFSNPSFEQAFAHQPPGSSSHSQAVASTQDAIAKTFEDCKTELENVMKGLEKSHDAFKLGGKSHDARKHVLERLLAPFKLKEIAKAVSKLYRQCQKIQAALAASTHVEITQARIEQQEWHQEDESRRILKWLSQLDFQQKHRDILSKRHPSTGQ